MDGYIATERLKTKSLLSAILLTGFLLMLAVNLILGVCIYKALNSKSRTFTPPQISKAFTISDTAVDTNYLDMMAEYLIHKKLNVTPANVHRQYGLLLDYVSEDNWPIIQPKFLREAEQIKNGNISSGFDVDKVEVALSDMKVRLTGVLKKYVGSRPLTPETVTYEVSFNYEYGEISLLSINRIEPSK